jgi:hypothetical protein
MKLSNKRNTQLICRNPFRVHGRSIIGKAFSILVFFFILLLSQDKTSFGQGVTNLVLLPPDTEDFPTLSVRFDISSPLDQPSPDVDINDLTLIENEQELPILSFEQVETGVHFALAVNGGREFDVRDANGVSPYQIVTSEIVDWASSRRFLQADVWSFVTNDGIAIHNTTSSRGWITALEIYQPNFRRMETNINALEKSIQMLSDWTVPFGVDKAILYITVPPAPDQIAAIRTLTQDAASAGIHVSIWMIGDGYFLTNDQGGALIDMSSRTGGQFFHFTGTETLPDPDMVLSSLGNYFFLTYQSEVRQTGSYPLRLSINLPEGPISGESTPFYIEISPPKPVLLSPPTTILRQAPSTAVEPMDALEPNNIAIEFIIEFPDGRPRDIQESRLYIDGELTEVSTTPPFNNMDWDISQITESGQHTIQIEVLDDLGLSSRTIEMPIVVEVLGTIPTPTAPMARQRTGLLISGAILLAAMILLLVWGIQQGLRSSRFSSIRQSVIKRFKKPRTDHLSEGLLQGSIYATLIPLEEILEREKSKDLLHIKQSQIILGSDPKRTGLALNEKGISPLHAQISLRNNQFWINDLGSSDGTWINYERIGSKLVELEPGDIVHFGNIGFRFTIIESVSPPSVEVQKFEPFS